jgi:hypothetical protein
MNVMPVVTGDQDEIDIWRLAARLAELLSGLTWVLVGGLMVRALEMEAGVASGWATSDVDAILDVRAISSATGLAATRLMAAGFQPCQEDGATYRFTKGREVVDLMAPDHVGANADLTTAPPGKTISTPGGRQALNRARILRLDVGDGPFELPVPSLAGALVIKALAADVAAAARQKHERDLARLLVIVHDPAAVRTELSKRERGYLRRFDRMVDPTDHAWAGIAGAEDGSLALEIILSH